MISTRSILLILNQNKLLSEHITSQLHYHTISQGRSKSSSKIDLRCDTTIEMPLRSTHHTTTTRSTRPSLMARLRARTAPRKTTRTHTTHPTTHATAVPAKTSRRSRRAHATPVTTTHTTAAPVHHHQRKASIGDRFSGAMLKLKGSLTRRPGQKAAGTRRMRGTDGRGARRYY